MNKLKFFFLGMMVMIMLAACKRESVPVPAISFHDTAKELPDKETNKWLTFKDHVASDPNTLGYMYDLRTMTYLTPDNDTIEYNFSHEKLLSVIVYMQKMDYDKALKRYQKDSNYKNIGNAFFEDANKVIVKIGRECGGKASFMYLNNEDNEITKMIELMKGATNSEGKSFYDYDSDHLFPQFLLGLIGYADAAKTFGNYEAMQSYYAKVLQRR